MHVRLLLDTCSFLWAIAEPDRLGARARMTIADPANEVLVSAASIWECAIKHKAGKLPLPGDPAQYLAKQRADHGFMPLPIDEDAIAHIGKLPDHHKDPFDRVLVCQAIVGGMTIVTPDEWLARYPVPLLW